MVEPSGQDSQECPPHPPPRGRWMLLSGAQGQGCALTSRHLLRQGQFLLSGLRGAEGLLPLLSEEQVPKGRAAEDVGGGADQ